MDFTRTPEKNAEGRLSAIKKLSLLAENDIICYVTNITVIY